MNLHSSGSTVGERVRLDKKETNMLTYKKVYHQHFEKKHNTTALG